jgi:membrane protease YdiL (CAAX protease family)
VAGARAHSARHRRAGRGGVRGVLPVVLSPVWAAVLFGLWHVLPSIKALDINGVATSAAARVLAVAGAVASTTVVGVVLWEIKVATGGLLAPALVHAAANSGATVAAYLVLRSAPAVATPGGVAAAHLLPHVAAEEAEQQPS